MIEGRDVQPCPFCAEPENLLLRLDEEFVGVSFITPCFVRCENCGAEGPPDNDKSKAIDNWNRRCEFAKR
jgi:Lar family restriction alleviation protein